MNFDFYDVYKQYPNTELLKIVKRPESYQPDAVVAATKLLAERNVTEDEMQFVDQYYSQKDKVQLAEKEKIEAYKNIATSMLYPERWIYLLLVLSVLKYGWSVYNSCAYFIRLFQPAVHGDIISIITSGLNFIYAPVVCYLLFKRKKWGWILLFADGLFVILSTVSQFYIFFKYWYPLHGSITEILFPLIIPGVFTTLLMQRPIKEQFHVDRRAKIMGVSIAVGLLVVVYACIFVMSAIGK